MHFISGDQGVYIVAFKHEGHGETSAPSGPQWVAFTFLKMICIAVSLMKKISYEGYDM